MMKTLWIDPNDLADVWTVNNRKENTGHIESLAESMRQNGYLPEYPIIAFEAANIPIETDKPYLVACGHHRRESRNCRRDRPHFRRSPRRHRGRLDRDDVAGQLPVRRRLEPRHRTRIH